MTINNNKLEALRSFLMDEGHFYPDELEELACIDSDSSLYGIGNREYLVLTDEEADEAVRESILNSLWAFNPHFIVTHMAFYEEATVREVEEVEKALSDMLMRLCETANTIVGAVITDIDDFIEDAVDSDGRGHFLSMYDGEENEEGEYYIYRVN